MKKISFLLTLIFILILLGTLLFYTQHHKKTDAIQTDTSDKKISLVDLSNDTVKQIHIQKGSNNLTFAQTVKGAWVIENTDVSVLDADKINSICTDFLKITASQQVKIASLQEFGLVSPSKTVTYDLKDGTHIKLALGDKTIDSENTYVQKDDDTSKAYLITTLSADSFDTDLNSYIVKDLDTFDPAALISLKASGKGIKPFTFKENPNASETGNAFVMDVADNETLEVDTDSFTKLLRLIPKLSADCLAASNSSDLKSYGLDNPSLHLVIETKDSQNNNKTKVLDYIWGSKTSDNFIYFMKTGSSAVYTMNSSFLEPLCQGFDVFNLSSKYIKLINIKNVNTIAVTLNGKSYTFSIKKQSAKNSDKSSETYSINGRDVPEKTFKQIYTALVGITFDAPVKKEVQSADKPIVVFSYSLISGKNETVSFYPYDDQFYSTSIGKGLQAGCSIKQFKYLNTLLTDALNK